MGFVVTGPMAVVRVSGSELYFERGAVLPEGIDSAHREHLIDVGLVTEVVVQKPEDDEGKQPEVKMPAPKPAAQKATGQK